MKHAEEELEDLAMENSSKETVSERHFTQTVAMPQTEPLSGNLYKSRLSQLYHSELLKIAVRPDIVIALKEIYLHASVHQQLQSREYADISFRDDIPIFVPEVPDIPKKIEGISILRKAVQKRYETTLATCRVLDIKPQMNIRYEICKSIAH